MQARLFFRKSPVDAPTFLFAAALFFTAAAFATTSWAAQAAELTVEVDGFESTQGDVRVALFEGAEAFPDKAQVGQRVKAEGNKVVVVFKDLRPGRYAVSAYHDVNENKKLDRGMFGIPKERYGFSQDARGFGGPPEFRDAAFEVPEAGARITVHLR